MFRTDTGKAKLAAAGTAATLAYPVIVIILQAVQARTYDVRSQAVSELALGRAGWLMAVAFCALALGTGALSFLAYGVTRSRTATGLLAFAAALTALAAFVHADGEHAKSTLHGQIHQVAGVLTFVSIAVGMFVLVRPLRRRPAWRRLGTLTLVMACLTVPAFFLVPVLGQHEFGIAQRVLLGLLIAWNALAQWYAHRAFGRRTADRYAPSALADTPA
jgi:uncharacterized membrane protein YidH (DUF202 family)